MKDPDITDPDIQQEFKDEKEFLRYCWLFMYWSVQLLTWVILPFF